MNHESSKRPWHLWVIGILATLWNAGGAFDYSATKLRLEFYMANFSEAQLEFLAGVPAWFTAFWAVAVWGALFASIALLFRSRWAVGLFAISLLGLIVTSIHSLFFSEAMELMRSEQAIFSAVIFVVSVLLLFYARSMSKRGVLR